MSSDSSSVWGKEGAPSSNTDFGSLFFEDNFDPAVHKNKTEFKKLDDQTQYLQILESKLAKIKNDPGTLKQLADRREQCMRSLMAGDIGIETGSQISLDRAVGQDENSPASEILRRINPQQPLTVGEVVPIVKHDQLEKRVNEEQLEEDNISR